VFDVVVGTMTAEAALLGVPTFSCYPDKLTNEFEDPINVILKNNFKRGWDIAVSFRNNYTTAVSIYRDKINNW
jgi:predicted glycosyltransferase